jgi:lantibiotic modifying enzyme
MGRVETLLVAGHRLATPQLNSAAREIASQTLSAANDRGRFVLPGGAVAEGYSPGFFQGLSGIGYQLLRVARPGLPSVLLFEVT